MGEGGGVAEGGVCLAMSRHLEETSVFNDATVRAETKAEEMMRLVREIAERQGRLLELAVRGSELCGND